MQFILKRIKQAMRSAKNEDIHVKGSLTIEHLMPVKWATKDWPLLDGHIGSPSLDRLLGEAPDSDADRRDQIIHTIGNLTLLTRPLNSSLQNGAWSEKRPEILGQSALALNREFHAYPEWNEKTIDKRGRELLTDALAIWPH